MNLKKDIHPMGKKLYPTDTLKQAQSLLIALEKFDSASAFGLFTSETLRAEITSVRELKDRISSLERELIGLRNDRDTATISLWDKVKRARSGVKALYGDDSTQYEIVGGTRRSERKKPRRKVRVE